MASRKKVPAAFLSYSHFDDEHEDGRITELRERLAQEVKFQTAEEFLIFQDRKDVKWGQNWKSRIDGALGSVTFLIPILTPGFFQSEYCLSEVEKFLAREKELDRDDLILPIYYFETPSLDDPDQRAENALVQAILAHQYADWRERRYEPWSSASVRKAVARLASQIRDSLQRQTEQPEASAAAASIGHGRVAKAPATGRRAGKRVPKKKSTAKGARRARPRKAQQPSETASTSEVAPTKSGVADAPRGPAPKTEPPTHVVDGLHRGDFTTISAAIKAAQPGDRILVRPGLYPEGLVIDKTLQIIGDGEPGDVVIEAEGKRVILFQTTMGRVANLTLRQNGGGDCYGVDITQGRLDLEDCDITSKSWACVAIHGAADPRLRRNRIHDGKKGGVFVYDNSQGNLEGNDIFGNALSGLEIRTGANPTVRGNRIHDGKEGGVMVHDNGQGALEDNDIFGNALAGVAINTGANPTLHSNRIHDGKQAGVFVHDNGQGTLEDNDIFGNSFGGGLQSRPVRIRPCAATASTRTPIKRFGSIKVEAEYSKITIFATTPRGRGIFPRIPRQM